LGSICTAVPIGTRALLVSQGRRHLFVTPCLRRSSRRNDNSSRFGKYLEVLFRDGVITGTDRFIHYIDNYAQHILPRILGLWFGLPIMTQFVRKTSKYFLSELALMLLKNSIIPRCLSIRGNPLRELCFEQKLPLDESTRNLSTRNNFI
jgi:hypothetical protein